MYTIIGGLNEYQTVKIKRILAQYFVNCYFDDTYKSNCYQIILYVPIGKENTINDKLLKDM